jgi:hypothetical protein
MLRYLFSVDLVRARHLSVTAEADPIQAGDTSRSEAKYYGENRETEVEVGDLLNRSGPAFVGFCKML